MLGTKFFMIFHLQRASLPVFLNKLYLYNPNFRFPGLLDIVQNLITGCISCISRVSLLWYLHFKTYYCNIITDIHNTIDCIENIFGCRCPSLFFCCERRKLHSCNQNQGCIHWYLSGRAKVEWVREWRCSPFLYGLGVWGPLPKFFLNTDRFKAFQPISGSYQQGTVINILLTQGYQVMCKSTLVLCGRVACLCSVAILIWDSL